MTSNETTKMTTKVSTHMETRTKDEIFNTSSSSDEETSNEKNRELHEYVVYVEKTVCCRYTISAYNKQEALDTYEDGEYEFIKEYGDEPYSCEEL